MEDVSPRDFVEGRLSVEVVSEKPMTFSSIMAISPLVVGRREGEVRGLFKGTAWEARSYFGRMHGGKRSNHRVPFHPNHLFRPNRSSSFPVFSFSPFSC